jgi:hypothetical protein
MYVVLLPAIPNKSDFGNRRYYQCYTDSITTRHDIPHWVTYYIPYLITLSIIFLLPHFLLIFSHPTALAPSTAYPAVKTIVIPNLIGNPALIPPKRGVRSERGRQPPLKTSPPLQSNYLISQPDAADWRGGQEVRQK